MAHRSLSSLFVDALAREVRPAFAACADLEDRLAALLEKARGAWPDVVLDPSSFLLHLASRLDAGCSPATLCGLRPGELHLAHACSRGDGAALACFEERFMPCVAAGLCRLRLDRWQRDEVAQMVRERLLVGSRSQPPRIALYNGRGDLAGWVRVVAVHTGLNHVRDTRRETAVGEQALIAASTQPATDVELSRLKQLYRTEFSEAFCHALASLTTRQRNLLRQHFLDGVTLDRLAVLYRVHRATAARWLAAARAELLARTQQDLMRRLRIEETEVRSIIRLVHSQLEVSLHQFLARPSVETP